MTTQEMAPPVVAARSYSEIMRGEVKAECARRDVNQRGVSALLGLSPQAVSDRWRGRTPWSLDEIESLESVLGLTRGSLLIACARRDSNPQPSDLSPLQVLLGLAASACQIDHNRVTECDECGKCTACDECRCYDSNWWERVVDDLVAVVAASAGCFECLELGCGGELACDCGCHDYDVEQERRREDLVVVADSKCWCSREGCTENYLVPCDCPCHGGVDDLVGVDAWELAA